MIVPAAVLTSVRPVVPKHLRDHASDATFRALFTIQANGAADVAVQESTGSPALDALALAAARQWTFRPATVDGRPVASYLRLRIEFSRP